MNGKITTIELQKKNKNRVNVFVDNEFSFSCDAEIIYKYNLKKNEVVDMLKMNEIAAEDNYIKAKNCAVSYIQRALKTEHEVANKLTEKGYDAKAITRVMEFMRQYNFVNDEEYVKAYINTEIGKNGSKKITYNLLRKGIPQHIINTVLNQIDDGEEINSARLVAEKKYKALLKVEEDKFKLYNKMIRYLTGRGYSYELCKKLTKEFVKYDED